MVFLQQTLNILVDLFITLIFLRVVLSWMVHDEGVLIKFLIQCTEPLLKPIRELLPRFGLFDFSPLILVLCLNFIRTFINLYL